MLIYCILGFLRFKPMTGYEIKAFMEKSTRNFMFASFGSIYPALKRLKKMKWISSVQKVENGRLRIIYDITPDGKEGFNNWLSSRWSFDKGLEEMLLRIFFGSFLPAEVIQSKYDELSASLDGKRDTLLKLEKEIPEANINSFQHSTLLYGKDFYSFTKKWIIEHKPKMLK